MVLSVQMHFRVTKREEFSIKVNALKVIVLEFHLSDRICYFRASHPLIFFWWKTILMAACFHIHV